MTTMTTMTPAMKLQKLVAEYRNFNQIHVARTNKSLATKIARQGTYGWLTGDQNINKQLPLVVDHYIPRFLHEMITQLGDYHDGYYRRMAEAMAPCRPFGAVIARCDTLDDGSMKISGWRTTCRRPWCIHCHGRWAAATFNQVVKFVSPDDPATLYTYTIDLPGLGATTPEQANLHLKRQRTNLVASIRRTTRAEHAWVSLMPLFGDRRRTGRFAIRVLSVNGRSHKTPKLSGGELHRTDTGKVTNMMMRFCRFPRQLLLQPDYAVTQLSFFNDTMKSMRRCRAIHQ